MRWLLGLFGALAVAFAADAQDEPRLALLIGNQDYPAVVGRLSSQPLEDVAAMDAALQDVGFETTVVTDADRAGMMRAILAFREQLAAAEDGVIGLFYYAGHGASAGIDDDRRNYLIPARAEITTAEQLIIGDAVELQRVVDLLHGALGDDERNALFVVMDACRNTLEPAYGARSGATRGFGVIAARPGLFLAYSTPDGSLAPDDGVYASALSEQITAPGQFAPRAFDLAGRTVARNRGYAPGQLPVVASALNTDICFVSCPGSGEAIDLDARDWETLSALGAAASYRSYLATHADGAHADEACLELLALVGPDEVAQLPACSDTSATTWETLSALGSAAGYRTYLATNADGLHNEDACAALLELVDPDEVALIAACTNQIPVTTSFGQPGDSFTECELCPEMVIVPAGEFVMGSPTSEAGRRENERPQRTVVIERPFAVGRFEVTFAEWDACVADGGCDGYEPSDQGWAREGRPVIGVSWNDAQTYVEWLNRQLIGDPYRLLTESEWEYVARAGAHSAYPWGASVDAGCGHANMPDQTALRENPDWSVANCDDGHYRTAPVGTYHANAFGVYDMIGNVWEWVEDCFTRNYDGAPTDGSTQIQDGCRSRVVRGGSWDLSPVLRSASRVGRRPMNRYYDGGFRLARTL